MRLKQLAALLVLIASAGPASAEGVAVTFDDVPSLALSATPADARATSVKLLRGLQRHHLPATGFVIAARLEGPDGPANTAVVKLWRKAGVTLGNHGYSHLSLLDTPVDAYVADIGRADQALRSHLGLHRTPHWFRPPYLETGNTTQSRRTFEAWLSGHGYRLAPVTMENADWMFALPYDDALARHDSVKAARIKASYLDYTGRVLPWYREAGRQLFGRRPDFVLLLHATRLNADSIDELAAILARNGLHGVTLAKAMRDSAYRTRDSYVGPDGDEWISRWSNALGKDLAWDSFPEPPADIAAENERLDVSP